MLTTPTNSSPPCATNSAATSKSPRRSKLQATRRWPLNNPQSTLSPAIHSDALVFFGATGDLAYKKIFPALQAMIKRGTLNIPVIGVAKAGWNLDQLKARAKDSLEKHGGLDDSAWQKLEG